jgi:hypothetical protein
LSKRVWKQQSNNGYETNHSAYKPMIVCNRKQRYYSDRRICEIMILNEMHSLHCNPATSTFLSEVGLVWKSRTQNRLLHIESTRRYTHHKQVKVVYNFVEKNVLLKDTLVFWVGVFFFVFFFFCYSPVAVSIQILPHLNIRINLPIKEHNQCP